MRTFKDASVSGRLILLDLEIAMTSPSFTSLLKYDIQCLFDTLSHSFQTKVTFAKQMCGRNGRDGSLRHSLS